MDKNHTNSVIYRIDNRYNFVLSFQDDLRYRYVTFWRDGDIMVYISHHGPLKIRRIM